MGPRGRAARRALSPTACPAVWQAGVGPHARFWQFQGSEQELALLLAEGSTRNGAATRHLAGNYEAMFAAFGLVAVNVPGFGANCFFHTSLCREAERSGLPLDTSFAAAERLRCRTFLSISARLRIARASGETSDADLLASLQRVRMQLGC